MEKKNKKGWNKKTKKNVLELIKRFDLIPMNETEKEKLKKIYYGEN